MTPAARIAAAIDVLDQIATGDAAERVLTRWARQNRYAGSKDRAAVRDHVFDVLRIRRTAAHLGSGTSGRQLMIGLLRAQGVEPASMFTGKGHAPAPLGPEEAAPPIGAASGADDWNIPDWLMDRFKDSLGPKAEPTARALQSRAPVTLRLNRAKTDTTKATNALALEGIETTPNPLSETALTVVSGERRIRQSQAYTTGLVELQDASSQAVVDLLPKADRALDYCAGGGGKALAMAARFGNTVFAHDVDPKRMTDIPERARRAGASIQRLTTDQTAKEGPFDLVLCDAPCSGSGAWRRSPEGKWSLNRQKLNDLTDIQDNVLETAKPLVKQGGLLVYATCSVLNCENEQRVQRFLDANKAWQCILEKQFDVSPLGDGFYTAHLTIA